MSNHIRLSLSSTKRILRSIALASVAVPIAVGLLKTFPVIAQSDDARTLKFEVATIRQNHSGETRVAGGFQPGARYHAVNYTLRALIATAYVRPQVNPGFLIEGGPKWIDSEHFDIDAKAAEEFPSGPDGPSAPRRVMLQALLSDRFKLKVHNETKEEPIYTLEFAKAARMMGPKLRPSSADCAAALAGTAPTCSARIGPGSFVATGTTLTQFVGLLPRFVDRIVTDSTGLTGRFDVQLKWTPAPGEWIAPPLPGDSGDVPIDGPSLFTAIQEQLGLKLESRKGPVDILVIDSVEMPSEN